LVSGSDIIALVKPQFEAGRALVGKKGIVRDEKVHLQVVDRIIDFSVQQGFTVDDLSYSPITGGDGNIEFLLHLKWEGEQENGVNQLPVDTSRIVKESHLEFKTK
jgi:23S rRNA (cytidine1920-2'-O)/16S rRNA (cytidine1409-2'-O)-methyltransferase